MAIQQVLLLTAAINTSPQMLNNLRNASDLRRADYHQGLTHYIDTLPDEVQHIVFCENTAADLSDFEPLRARAAQAGKVLHFVSFKGQTPPERGKGICEFEILDTAYRWLGERFSPDTIVWKVTGRLMVKNMATLIRSYPKDAEVYVDMRSVPVIGERLGGNDWAEMRLMGYTLTGYQRFLLGRGEQCGRVTEKGLFTVLKQAYDSGAAIAPRFRAQPRLKGICGGSNKDYESLEYRVKDMIRMASRTFAPGVWL